MDSNVVPMVFNVISMCANDVSMVFLWLPCCPPMELNVFPCVFQCVPFGCSCLFPMFLIWFHYYVSMFLIFFFMLIQGVSIRFNGLQLFPMIPYGLQLIYGLLNVVEWLRL